MENESNQTSKEECDFATDNTKFLVSIDVLTLLIGQPVITKLMWIAFTSKKPADILNFSLALFHNFQYFMSLLHLISLHFLPRIHLKILRVLLMYAQIGGPMSLCFITIERYVAVIQPMSYYLLKKYKCREAGAVVVWFFSVNIALMAVYPIDSSRSAEIVFKTLPFYVMVIMCGVMLWCSRHVVRALMKSGPGRDVLHPMKKRAFKTVCATTTLTLFCYIPVAAMQKVQFLDETLYNCKLTPLCIMLLSIASIVHPLFYLFSQGQLFVCLKKRKKAG